MNALVVYDSQYGNTERIALAIAEALRSFGTVHAVKVGAADPAALQGVDLLVLGSPTQGWHPTKPTQAFFDRATHERPRGMAIACFDTRFQKSRWLTGSAANYLAKRLRQGGIQTLVPAESFFVGDTEGPLLAGELERATTWGRILGQQVGTPQPAPAGV